MKTLGILNIESGSVHVTGIEDYRPVSASSFLGRYRVLDFMISNFTNSGIDNMQVYFKNRPRSTIEHIHATNYNINAKRGRIHILGGEKTYTNPLYNTDIASFNENRKFIEESNAEYVVIAPSYFVFIQDFSELLKKHIESGNDITVLYQTVTDADTAFELCGTLRIDEKGRVNTMGINAGKYKHRNISLETYVLSRKLFLELIDKAVRLSSLYWFVDIVRDSLVDLKVGAIAHRGYVACINTLRAYYSAQLELRSSEALSAVISSKWPIYTMSNDTCPTWYSPEGEAVGSLVGNGCKIEGKVLNSVIGRDVYIGRGSTVEECVVLPGARIEEGIHIKNAVIDRYAHIALAKQVYGDQDEPLYVKRGDCL